VIIFFIAGLLYLLRFRRVDNLGTYRIPSETRLLIPSGYANNPGNERSALETVDWLDAVRSAQDFREKDFTLLAAASDIFGRSRPWERVKAGFSNAKIREFYTVIANLWPPDTNLEQILPEPDSTLRAPCLGEYEPELMLENVFRFCLYTDQILLSNPFQRWLLQDSLFSLITSPRA
jgi:hypothetical protein